MIDRPELFGIVVAALGGAAIGVERQRSGHASGRHARFGGVRTFTLLGAVAGVAGWMTTIHLAAFGVVLAAGATALVIAGYLAASPHGVDATTEAAGLVVVAAGVTAGLGWLSLASAIIAVSVLLLVEKSRLHHLVARIDDEELRAAARFGVMAVVILPLLPAGPFGPWGGVRPRALWLLVLLFTGLSFLGYLARRLFGANQGYPLAGLLGGMISSTNVTYVFARLSRRERGLSRPLAIGVVGACTMLFPRVVVAAAVLSPPVALRLLPLVAAPFLVGVVALAWWWMRHDGSVEHQPGPPRNPLQFGPALEMALLFQVVLFAVAAMQRAFGDSGLLVSGAVLGLTDVDALTIAMTSVVALGGGDPVTAAEAIAIGILANCVLKTALAVALGTPQFRRLSAALTTAMSVAIALSMALWR